MDYKTFLNKKDVEDAPSGLDVDISELNGMMFPFQKAITKWGLKRGRAAVFLNTGLGKSLVQLDWCRLISEKTNKPTIIITPLAVAEQFMREAEKFGIKANHIRDNKDVINGINITNYEILHKIDCRQFVGVALDESSILKQFDAKYRTTIIDTFSKTPYRLSASATPAPNDYMELGNQAQFLGVLSYHEMLATFFVHDSGQTQKWRLKKHAEDEFWKWMCGWAVNIRKPSNIGFDDTGYNLPPLNQHLEVIETMEENDGKLTLSMAKKVRRQTVEMKVDKVVEIVNKYDKDEPILIWCGLNDESKMLMQKLKHLGAVEVKGSDSHDKKEHAAKWCSGAIPSLNRKILISKPSIFGFGMNFQECATQIFCGVDYSFEGEYQAIRRSWRFGQKKPVNIHFVLTNKEESIMDNVRAKEQAFEKMYSNMVEHMKEFTKQEIVNSTKFQEEYNDDLKMIIPEFLKAA